MRWFRTALALGLLGGAPASAAPPLEEPSVTAQAGAAGSQAEPAAEGTEEAGGEEAAQDEVAREVVDPLPGWEQLQVHPSYIFLEGGGPKTEILVQPVLPYAGFLIPGVEVPRFRSVARLQWSAVAFEQRSTGLAASGLGDLAVTDLALTRLGPVEVGAGFGTVVPIATNPLLGQGKWQLGPALAVVTDAIPHLLLGAVGQQLFSVAGSSLAPDRSYLTVQPTLAIFLPAATFVYSNAPMEFDWKEGGDATIPVNLGLGHAFSSTFAGAVQGWYTLTGRGEGDIRAAMALDFLL